MTVDKKNNEKRVTRASICVLLLVGLRTQGKTQEENKKVRSSSEPVVDFLVDFTFPSHLISVLS